MHAQLEQILGKRVKETKKKKNLTTTFEESGAKAGYCACPLHTTPPKGWENHRSYPPAIPLDTHSYPYPM